MVKVFIAIFLAYIALCIMASLPVWANALIFSGCFILFVKFLYDSILSEGLEIEADRELDLILLEIKNNNPSEKINISALSILIDNGYSRYFIVRNIERINEVLSCLDLQHSSDVVKVERIFLDIVSRDDKMVKG